MMLLGCLLVIGYAAARAAAIHPSNDPRRSGRSPSIEFDEPASGWWWTCRLSRLPMPKPAVASRAAPCPFARNAASHWWLAFPLGAFRCRQAKLGTFAPARPSSRRPLTAAVC